MPSVERLRISIDPNGSSPIWPGMIAAYLPEGQFVFVDQLVTVVQDGDGDEPDFVGEARIIGTRGRFMGLDVAWESFHDEQTTEAPAAVTVRVSGGRPWLVAGAATAASLVAFTSVGLQVAGRPETPLGPVGLAPIRVMA